MENKAFSDTIQLGNRQFRIESRFGDNEKCILSTISENDHIIKKYQFPVHSQTISSQIEVMIADKHKSILDDWELLFYIFNKVKNVNHAPSFNKLGLVLMNRNMLPEAIDCFEKAIAQDRDFFDAHINLAKAYIKAEIYDEAIQILNSAIEMSPEFADLHYLIAVCYLKKSEYTEALKSLEKALQINPKYDAAHYMLGMVYLDSMAMKVDTSDMIPISLRQKKILAHLQRAIDFNPSFANQNVRQAMKEIQDEKYQKAMELLETIDVRPGEEDNSNYDEEFYLNFMFGGKSKDERIIYNYIRHLQHRIDEKPDYPDVHNKLGIAYLIQCRNMFLKAVEQFRQALKLNPQFENAKKNLKLAENEGKGFIILLRALLK